jgi:type VI secretion system VasD/TssJ family lipoprotein
MKRQAMTSPLSNIRCVTQAFAAVRLSTLPVLLAASLVSAGCSLGGNTRKDAMSQLSWDYAADAVILEVAAQPNLNLYDDQAHTLLLGIFQMSDAAAFRELSVNPAAIANVMGGGKPGSGFLQFTRYVVSPGQHSILMLDRAQKTQLIGVIAGYYHLNTMTAVQVVKVPVDVSSKGWISKTYQAMPSPLTLRMDLGSDGILNIQSMAKSPDPVLLRSAVVLDSGGKEVTLSADACCAASGTTTPSSPN